MDIDMDTAEFTESFMNVKLLDWQKEYLKKLYEFQRNNPDKRIYINVRPHQGRDAFYTYFKEFALKELTQSGPTPNSH